MKHSFLLLTRVLIPLSSSVTMTAAALIGDQLILEEDYDENYIPSEPGNHLITDRCTISPKHTMLEPISSSYMFICHLQFLILIYFLNRNSRAMPERLALILTWSQTSCGLLERALLPPCPGNGSLGKDSDPSSFFTSPGLNYFHLS